MTKKTALFLISLIVVGWSYPAYGEGKGHSYKAPCSVQRTWRKYLRNKYKGPECPEPRAKQSESYTVERSFRRRIRRFEVNGVIYEREQERQDIEIRRR